ncbi:50S ribosomal protein L23 [Chryseotalea sanaruensis]|jgi:large subunit ribosomal protein L23|uniref:Large ribosomal subunit protein uL23 n=1 Tax=Chryseotalea sanaruensis TaxID=2482724 RepID=A0A401UF85_9BACT|nr:50S ribosomal protein L23 [Chryseotalea sanaruensis]MCZ8215220.1 50S ribosomal protein L23 [Cyclobacteriaceae bacterium]NBP68584.1 50S ribosomal protein L23 [Cytophagia bacterium]NBW37027.1 50S ribosomal protein L23 [Cytophagia bacterium]GCC53571.1 50S ribosomal protein L23 [Chryseotalea sanaruensis]
MSVLKKPLVTEKVSAMNEKGKYGFIVDTNANKVEIKKAVEKQYGVNVKSVNTMKVMGKFKVRYTKAGVLAGRKPNYKKAIVTLAAGEVIDFYSNV